MQSWNPAHLCAILVARIRPGPRVAQLGMLPRLAGRPARRWQRHPGGRRHQQKESRAAPYDALAGLERAPGIRALLVVDQYEETYTVATGAQRARFEQALVEQLQAPDFYLVLAARADFYANLMASPLWAQIRAHRLEITPPRGDDLRGEAEIVWNARFAPDGTRIVTSGYHDVVRVWDGESGQALFCAAGCGVRHFYCGIRAGRQHDFDHGFILGCPVMGCANGRA
jgi:hypothetical protein